MVFRMVLDRFDPEVLEIFWICGFHLEVGPIFIGLYEMLRVCGLKLLKLTPVSWLVHGMFCGLTVLHRPRKKNAWPFQYVAAIIWDG